MRIATLMAPDLETARLQAAAAVPHADLLELRLDPLGEASRGRIDEFLGRAPLPVVAACRRRRDGGSFEAGEEARTALLRRAMDAGAAYVDVEIDTPAESLIRPGATRFVLSHHDPASVPADLEAIASRLRARGDVWMRKVAVAGARATDCLRIRSLLARPGPALAAFCMGETGRLSRILARAWGSAATYGAAGDVAGAPGQLPVAELDEVYREDSLGPETRLVGLLGHPVAHSLSPRIHNAAFRHLGLDWVYLPLESPDAGDGLRTAQELHFRGLSVTLPHKEAVLEHVTRRDGMVSRVEAVNTVVLEGAAVIGWNTDVEAALEPLRSVMRLSGARAAILGTGGAARALAHGLRAAGAEVAVFGRRGERARRLAQEVGGAGGALEEVQGHPQDLLVNATPVGMWPEVARVPVPAAWVHAGVVYDLVYNPRPTRLLREAARAGSATLDGTAMFLAQAAAQFRIFTGEDAPEAVMRAALDAALRTGPEA